jgi:hypothetical protein
MPDIADPVVPPDHIQAALAVQTDNDPKPEDGDQSMVSQDPTVAYEDEGEEG